MRSMQTAILTLLFTFFTQALLFAQQSALEQRADSLYRVFAEEQALEAYSEILQENPRDYEALWRASFLNARVGHRQESEKEKKRYFNRAEKLAGRALAVDSTGSGGNFAMAVAMGRKALIAGPKERVAASRTIRKYAERALKQDSTHAGAWHVIGRWHHKVANLSFIERLAANTLFGGIPGNASNRKAIDAMHKAIRYSGDYVLYYRDLAMVYEDMGRKKQAVEACRSALELQSLTPDDPRLKKECRELIQRLQ